MSRGRVLPALIAVVLIAAVLVSGGALVARVAGFLRATANVRSPGQLIQQQLEPPVGSIAWKLKHGQQVNLLALGYGGPENDAPYLTDSIMVVSLDPASQRILEASVPRDLYVSIDAFQDGSRVTDKINAAFEVPNQPRDFAPGPLKPQFQGKDGPGHLAAATVSRLTGLTFDGYAALDFKAFRDVVDALGGVQVHMEGPLDDCHYPDYHDGYLNGGVPLGYACPPGAGIHFQAGDYVVNGEQALELARSRDAVQPEQANDFGRSTRQQMIVAAIKKKAGSVSAITKAPQLMDALQNNFQTDMDLTDMKAVYDFASKLPDQGIGHLAITDQNLLDGFDPYTRGSCGPADAFVLCPEDDTYRTLQAVFARAFVPKPVLAEQAPVQLVNASVTSPDLQDRATDVLHQLGLQTSQGIRGRALATSTVYDYSGGRYPATAVWLRDFFGADVVPAPSPAPAQQPAGLVVMMGSDFARRWYGLA